MANRSSIPLTPQSLEAQKTPVFANRRTGGKFAHWGPPQYPRLGGVLDYHISCVLQARYCPGRRLGGPFRSKDLVVRGIARVEQSQAVQIDVYV